MPAVPGAAFAFNQAPLRELIDQYHHSAGQNAQKPNEALLIRPRNPRDEPKDPGMGGGDSKMRDSRSETIRSMRAELGE